MRSVRYLTPYSDFASSFCPASLSVSAGAVSVWVSSDAAASSATPTFCSEASVVPAASEVSAEASSTGPSVPASPASGRFTLNRFCPRGALTRCSTFGAALIEPVHRLVDLVHHLFANSGNLHQLLGRH